MMPVFMELAGEIRRRLLAGVLRRHLLAGDVRRPGGLWRTESGVK